MTFSDQLQRYGMITEQALHEILDRREDPVSMHDAMAYSLFAGGKRIRPALCLAACTLTGGREADALPAACALEMIHTYSLIHDDLPAMDDDPMRRGKPSNHIVFGEANAILAGDGLLSLAFAVLSETGKAKAIAAVARAATDMVAGQVLDLNVKTDGRQLERIQRLKTSALMIGAVEAGAYCAEAKEQEVKALALFASRYGLLFQMTDDILDVTGSTATLGKSVGKDAASDKLTTVSCYGLDEARRKTACFADEALAALHPFGEAASFFRELIDATLCRLT